MPPSTPGDAVPPVFAPAPLGPLTLRNRIIKAATFEGVMPGGRVSDDLIDFHRRVAAGGAALSTVAYLAVSPEGRTDRHCLLLNEETVPGLRRLTDAVHAEGAAALHRSAMRGRSPTAVQRRARPLALGRPDADGLASARRRRRRDRAHHRGLPRAATLAVQAGSTASRSTSGTTTY